jgi:hypothetical protein
MELIIRNSGIGGDWDGLNLGEVSRREPRSTGATHDVIGRMFVGMSSLMTVLGDDLCPGVDAKPLVGEYGCAFSIDNGTREICGVNATREKEGGVKVDVLGQLHCVWM